ncbi:MAG: DUF881 domain-containing protein [Peptostreptococcaceae bacterium]|nr:DUF881 domain-containing protein [Peptostreptococcaceae bacterium]
MRADQKFMVLGFILSLFLGTSFVILMNSPIQANRNSFIAREIVSQINEEKLALQKNEKRINVLSNEHKEIEKQKQPPEELLSEEQAKAYAMYKIQFARENITGEGVILLFEPDDPQKNLAFTFDSNRLLLKIVNLAKRKGGEFVAINNQPILNNTGIVLAGNHININNVPITPPYEVKIIGNEKTLYRFFTEESVFMLSFDKNYGTHTSISRSRKIEIPKTHFSREIEFIQEGK